MRLPRVVKSSVSPSVPIVFMLLSFTVDAVAISIKTAQMSGSRVFLKDKGFVKKAAIIVDGQTAGNADGTIVSWVWKENRIRMGNVPTLMVRSALGSHSSEQILTDT